MAEMRSLRAQAHLGQGICYTRAALARNKLGRPALAGGYRSPKILRARVLAFASTVSGAALVGRRAASRLCAHSLFARLRCAPSLLAFAARFRCAPSLLAFAARLCCSLLLSLALALCAAPRCRRALMLAVGARAVVAAAKWTASLRLRLVARGASLSRTTVRVRLRLLLTQ